MKRLRWLIVLAGFCAACVTTKSGPTDTTIPPAVTSVLDCVKDDVHKQALDIIDDVGSDLASGDWVALLKDLAGKATWDAVDCAVRYVAGESNHNAMASDDPLESEKAARGRQWLAARGRDQ